MKSIILPARVSDLIEKVGEIPKKKVFGNKNWDRVLSKFKKDKPQDQKILIPPFNLLLTKENPLKGIDIARVEIVQIGVRSLESGVWSQKVEVRSQESEGQRVRGPEVRSLESGVWSQKVEVRSQESEGQGVRESEDKRQTIEPKVQNPESKPQTIDHSPQRAEVRLQSDRATGQQSDRATEPQGNRATELQSNRTTEPQSDRATERQSDKPERIDIPQELSKENKPQILSLKPQETTFNSQSPKELPRQNNLKPQEDRIQDTGYRIQDSPQTIEVRSQESEGQGVRVSEDKRQTIEPKVQNPESKPQTTEHRTQEQILNSQSAIRNSIELSKENKPQKYKIEDTEYKPQTIDNKHQTPDNRQQTPNPRPQNIDHRPQRIEDKIQNSKIPEQEISKTSDHNLQNTEYRIQNTEDGLKLNILKANPQEEIRNSKFAYEVSCERVEAKICNSNKFPIPQEQIFDKENSLINIERHKEKDEFFPKDYKDFKDYKDNKSPIFQSNILKEPISPEKTPETLNPSIENPKKQDFSLDKKLYEIVQQADLKLANAKTEMNIILKPEFLGKLNMKLTMNEGILDTKFTVGNPHLKELIETNLHNLRETFSQLEVGVGNIEVSIENGFLSQRNLWNKTYNETQPTNQSFIFEPKESFQFHLNDDKLARLYWTQASFEFTA
ncbi:MAG: flagellar hook-length control protein FliK [bacterium]